MEGINPAPRGTPQIEVTLDIDANGILNVSAKDKNTGKENKITIKSDSGLSKEEIERMVQEAEQNAESDKKAKELIEARNSAEGQVHSVKKDFEEYKDQITEEEKTKLEEAFTSVTTATAGDDVEEISKSVQTLFESATPLFTKKQEAETAKQQAAEKGEQTVDASFTEVDTDTKK